MTEAPEPATGLNGRTHTRYQPGAPCWVSLMVHDMAVTQAFYGDLFGWEFEPGPRRLGPYVRALLNGREVAGVGLLPPDRPLPVAWTPYFASDDVDLTAETVRLCGGTVGVGPLDADSAGRLLIASDPGGAVFGVWQAAAHLGTDLMGVPGTPVWNELRTFETANVTKFYGSLFGYAESRRGPDATAEPASGPPSDYVTLTLDGRPVAGVHGLGHALPRERGPHWTTYFEVADTDETLERLAGLGGRVLTPPQDTSYGRATTVSDPEGARFALVQSGR
ncbi:VOC family protein [Streptomyces sp. NPDC018610]|uniref:VOC family protein n=1 Tax=Streptomyces sp. NPDC018610 TaxID=3365049 RepID=UPI0037BABE3E